MNKLKAIVFVEVIATLALYLLFGFVWGWNPDQWGDDGIKAAFVTIVISAWFMIFFALAVGNSNE